MYSGRSPHGLLGIVVEIEGKVRRANDALELPDTASFMTHNRGAFLDRLRRQKQQELDRQKTMRFRQIVSPVTSAELKSSHDQ